MLDSVSTIFAKGASFCDILLHAKPFLKRGLLHGEQILSFKNGPIFRRETKQFCLSLLIAYPFTPLNSGKCSR